MPVVASTASMPRLPPPVAGAYQCTAWRRSCVRQTSPSGSSHIDESIRVSNGMDLTLKMSLVITGYYIYY